jgi:hypothetical protein
MNSDGALRKQLAEARESIEAQLWELEATSRGRGDCRAIYAQLQKELEDINELLGAGEDDDDCERSEAAACTYRPLSMNDTQGRQPKRSFLLALITLMGVLWLVFLLFRGFIAT